MAAYMHGSHHHTSACCAAAGCSSARISLVLDTAVILVVSIILPLLSLRLRLGIG